MAWLWHAPASALVVVMVTILVLTTIYGATRPHNGRPVPAATTPQLSPSNIYQPPPSPQHLQPAPQQPAISEAIRQVQANPDLQVGVAISAIASPAHRTQDIWLGGTLRDGQSWQTIDVAMAVAILTDPKQPEDSNYLFTRALTMDSAAGDDAIWAFLGSAEQASGKTMAVLRDYGDYRSVVPVNPARGYAPYLNTRWPLRSQTEFMSALSCNYPQVYPVLTHLDSPDPETGFGLAVLPRAFSKAGSGISDDGTLVVRQYGLIYVRGIQEVAVGLMVSSRSGDQAGAQAAATKLANALYANASGFAGYAC